MLDIRELLNLKEAYAEVYNPQELTEEQVWEEVETWVNSLIEEGHDLSDYTWEEMYESYLEEQGQRMTTGQATAPKVAPKPKTANLVPIKGVTAGGPVSLNKPYPSQLGGKKGEVTYTQNNNNTVRRNFRPSERQGPYVPERLKKAPPTADTSPVKPTPARPAAGAPARPAATAAPKPAAATTPAPAKPAPGTKAAGPESIRPKTPNPLMQKTFGYQTGNSPRDQQSRADKIVQSGAVKALAPKPSTPTPAASPVNRATGSKKPGSIVSGFDMFDVVKGYLIGEGYADTEEAALAIMTNMSEEWREDIMEISRKTATKAYAQSVTGEFEGADDASDVRRTDNLGKHIERKFGKKALEDANRHADSTTFGRKDPRTGKRQPKPESRFQNPNKYRTTKDGKMHGQDQNKLKAKLERARAQKESFNIFVNSMITEGISMERYTWEEIQNVFDDLFEAQVANRNPDEYERKAKQGQSREQQLKGRVMGRMNQMDPEKRKKMLAQMRAVGLDV